MSIMLNIKRYRNVINLLFVLLFVYVVRSFIAEMYVIPSGSMEPSLQVGDFILVTKWDYGYNGFSMTIPIRSWKKKFFSHTPKRGDIVVFFPENDAQHRRFVKRVIGVAQDKIQVIDSQLEVNYKTLYRTKINEIYKRDMMCNTNSVNMYEEKLSNDVVYKILQSKCIGPLDNTPIYHVPSDSVFMMGDNRDNSADSRVIGPVHNSYLVGKTAVVLFNIHKDLSIKSWFKWRIGRFLTKV